MSYELKEMKLRSNVFPFNLFNETLELIFLIDNTESLWESSFEVKMDKEGNIVNCSSLTSTMDNIDYYISMGENLKMIKEFCNNYGARLYKRLKETEKRQERDMEVIYKEENENIDNIKEAYGYEDLVKIEYDLFNEYTELEKQYRRLRKEDKKMEKQAEIDVKVKLLNEVRGKIEDIKRLLKDVNKVAEAEEMEIKQRIAEERKGIIEIYNSYLFF